MVPLPGPSFVAGPVTGVQGTEAHVDWSAADAAGIAGLICACFDFSLAPFDPLLLLASVCLLTTMMVASDAPQFPAVGGFDFPPSGPAGQIGCLAEPNGAAIRHPPSAHYSYTLRYPAGFGCGRSDGSDIGLGTTTGLIYRHGDTAIKYGAYYGCSRSQSLFPTAQCTLLCPFATGPAGSVYPRPHLCTPTCESTSPWPLCHLASYLVPCSLVDATRLVENLRRVSKVWTLIANMLGCAPVVRHMKWVRIRKALCSWDV
ncbi:hypothetical protein VTK26DRAFT_3142 [Humicola hyalothermophila]